VVREINSTNLKIKVHLGHEWMLGFYWAMIAAKPIHKRYRSRIRVVRLLFLPYDCNRNGKQHINLSV